MTQSVQLTKDQLLVNDIRRAMLLGDYIRHWGQPSSRTLSQKAGVAAAVEVYVFPPDEQTNVYRFATVGVSAQPQANGETAQWELLLCLPADLGGADEQQVIHYLLDIMAYSLRDDVNFVIGNRFPVSPLAPSSWTTKALLLDEPRGEPEEMANYQIGQQAVDLIWLIPITAGEKQFIDDNGLEDFDDLVEKSEDSILDVNRPSMI